MKDPSIREFNHILLVEILKLCDGNVLLKMDVRTLFRNGCLFNSMNAETAWKFAKKQWIDIYAGASNFIHLDAVTNFNSLLF